MFALGRYQIEDPSFHPFTSKYDAWLQGHARFTPTEARGYLAFNDPLKGNCAACHLSKPTVDGLPPLFTDFQYEALGVPRNKAIPANSDPAYFDLGICGPYRTNMTDQTQYCGMFLTPSLRNTATRQVFFHNGAFHTLEEVLDWYVNRDLQPERFYPRDANGAVVKYDDIPEKYRANVDTTDAPFDRKPGDKPALNKKEIADIIAFLRTLSDGYGRTLNECKSPPIFLGIRPDPPSRFCLKSQSRPCRTNLTSSQPAQSSIVGRSRMNRMLYSVHAFLSASITASRISWRNGRRVCG